jgi:lipase chaperone LimK
MTKYPELEAHFQRYVAEGYAPDLFDMLVTAAPTTYAVAQGDSLAGYCSREKTITADQKADAAFLWGYANYLRDKSILPPVHQCTGDDFDQLRQLKHQLYDVVVRLNTIRL